MFEADPTEVNFRYGGDARGLINKLDYIQSMGNKAIYIAGTIFVSARASLVSGRVEGHVGLTGSRARPPPRLCSRST